MFNNHLYLTLTGSTQVGNTEPYSDTKKERPETTTGPLLFPSDHDLLHTYRPSIFLTLGLSTDSRICTLRVINTQRQNRPLKTPSPTFLHSHAQIPAESIHVILQIIYTPKAQAFFLDKFTKLQTFQSSSSLSLSLQISATTT